MSLRSMDGFGYDAPSGFLRCDAKSRSHTTRRTLDGTSPPGFDGNGHAPLAPQFQIIDFPHSLSSIHHILVTRSSSRPFVLFVTGRDEPVGAAET